MDSLTEKGLQLPEEPKFLVCKTVFGTLLSAAESKGISALLCFL